LTITFTGGYNSVNFLFPHLTGTTVGKEEMSSHLLSREGNSMHPLATKAACWSVLALVATTLTPAGSEMRKAELVGIPVKAVVFGNSHGVLAKSPRGQPGMFYIPYYSTTGSALVGYHSATKELVIAKLG